MFDNPNPGCEKECVFRGGMTSTTAMYFEPQYDKNGNNLNPDGNITMQYGSCVVCNRQWVSTTQYGETVHTEVK